MTPRTPAARPAAIPLAPVALGLAAGIGAASTGAGGALVALVAPLVIVLAAGAPRLRPALLALLLGLLLGRLEAPDVARPKAFQRARLPAVHGVEGRVLRADPTGARTQRLLIEIDALGQPPRALLRSQRVEVRLLLRGMAAWHTHDLVPGARVRGLMRISLRGGRLRGYVHDRRALEVVASSRSVDAAIARLRTHASWALSRGFDRRDDGLARALLLGDRGRLDARDRTLFRRTGQAHLLAVSGLHVGLLLGGLLLVMRLLGAPPRVLWSAGLLIVAVYVPFTGAQPSAVRAGLGAAVWFAARLLGRRPWGAAVLTLVGVTVLGTRPGAIAEVSFQLSFAAVTAILLVGPALRNRLVPSRPVIAGLLPRRRAPLRTALAISIAAWLGTAPFVATYIGRLCPAGPLLSLCALPLTATLLGSSFVYLLGTLTLPSTFVGLAPLAALSRSVFEAAADLLRRTLELAQAARLDALDVASPGPLWWILYPSALALATRAGSGAATAGWCAAACLLCVLFLPAGVAGLSVPHAPWNPEADEYDAHTLTTVFLAADVSQPALVPSLAVGAALLLLALVSVRLCWLGPEGAGAAWGLGLVAFFGFGGPGLAALLAPFLVATLLGKMPGAERAAARDLRQVLCNGVPAFLGCLFAISGRPDIGGPFFLGALACLGGDSCATEVGTRYGGQPFRLAGRGPIQRGESGGVTWAGLVATLFGAALAPAAFFLGLVLGSDMGVAGAVRGLGLMTAAGAGGAILDSVLGGWLQFRGRGADGATITESTWVAGAPTERVSGWRWLDNDAVNLVSGTAAGVFAVALAYLA